MTNINALPYRCDTETLTGQGNVRLWRGIWRPVPQAADPTHCGIVVLSHGYGEYVRRYDRLIRALTEGGYTVVGHDHRGHGKSEGSPHDIDDFDDFVRDLDQSVQRAREIRDETPGMPGSEPFLLGHSMGGLIATRYVMQLADQAKLSGLILSSPAFQLVPELSPLALRALGVVARVAPHLPVDPPRNGVLSRDPNVNVAVDEDPEFHHGWTKARLAHRLSSMGVETRARLHRITLPLLLVYGEDDRLVDPEGSRVLARTVSSRDLTVRAWPGLRHEILNEPEGELAAQSIVDWLAARTRAVCR